MEKDYTMMNAFFYWGGGNLSWLRYLTMATFRRQNPDYKIILVVPKYPSYNKTWKTPHQNGFFGGDWIDHAKAEADQVIEFDMEDIGYSNDLPEVHKSDIVRVYMLRLLSGVWTDFDILWLRPIPENLENVSFLHRKPGTRSYAIGFLGAAKGCLFYQWYFDMLRNANQHISYQKYGTDVLKQMPGKQFCGEYVSERNFSARFPCVKNIPADLVYHYSVSDLYTKPQGDIPASVIGVHWYAGHPKAGIYERLITQEHHSYPNLLCSIINKLHV